MDNAPVQVHRLDNGAEVWLRVERTEPRVAARVLVKAGASREPAAHTGLAHLLEHLLANKGSARLGTLDPQAEAPHLARQRALIGARHRIPPGERPALDAPLREAGAAAAAWLVPNELKRCWAAIGARGVNAFTSHDLTAFVAELPAHRLAAWATLEADRLSGPSFRGALTELDTVLEEKLRGADDPARCLAHAVNAALWRGHPYARDVLGELEHLLNPSFDAIAEFFFTWYTPANLVIALSGDLEPGPTLDLLGRTFGALRGAPPPTAPLPSPTPLLGEQAVELHHHGDEELRLVWQVPGRSAPEHEALLLMDMVLSNHATGLLDRRLVQTQRVRAAGSNLALRAAGGSFTVWARPRVGQAVDELRALLLEQVEAVRQGDFDAEDLRAAALNFEVHERARLERNDNAALALALTALHDQSWEHASGWLERLRAQDPAQVAALAARVLGPDRVCAVRRAGTPTLPTARALGLGSPEAPAVGGSAFAAQAIALRGPDPTPQVLRVGEDALRAPLPWGTLYHAPNPTQNGLGHISLAFDLGTGHDPVWAVALRLWERAGAGELDLEALSGALYRRALSLSSSPGRWSTRITLGGPVAWLPEGLHLLARRLREPRLSEAERQAFLGDLIARRRERAMTRDKRVAALNNYALLGASCPEITERLSDEDLRALPLDTLRQRPARLLGLSRVAFCAGPPEPGPWLEALDALAEPPTATLEIAPQRYPAASAPCIYTMDHVGAQATVTLLHPEAGGPAGPDPLPGLWAEYLGGGAGLLFQELREARGLAYSVRAGYALGSRPVDDNLLWASVGTQPERAHEVVALLAALLERPLERARFERARHAALESLRTHRVPWRQIGPSLEAWACRGLHEDPRPALIRGLEQLDLQGLEALAGRARGAPLRFCVVGDHARLDLAALARLAEVRVVEPALLLAVPDAPGG